MNNKPIEYTPGGNLKIPKDLDPNNLKVNNLYPHVRVKTRQFNEKDVDLLDPVHIDEHITSTTNLQARTLKKDNGYQNNQN